MPPCESHFDEPSIVYKPDDKEYSFLKISKRYNKKICDKCGWCVATRIIETRKKPKRIEISYKIDLPDSMKYDRNPFVMFKVGKKPKNLKN